jgi:hypothetical protein
MDIKIFTELPSCIESYQLRYEQVKSEKIKRVALYCLQTVGKFLISAIQTIYILEHFPKFAPLAVILAGAVSSKLHEIFIDGFHKRIDPLKKEESTLIKALSLPDPEHLDLDSNSYLSPFDKKIFKMILQKVKSKSLKFLHSKYQMATFPEYREIFYKYNVPALEFYAKKAIENRPDKDLISVHVLKKEYDPDSPVDLQLDFDTLHTQLLYGYKNEFTILAFTRPTLDPCFPSIRKFEVKLNADDLLSVNNYEEAVQRALFELEQAFPFVAN